MNKLFDEAINLYRQNNYEASLLKADEIINRDSTSINAYLLKAEVYGVLNKTLKELEVLQTAISLGANKIEPKVNYLMANASYKNGDYKTSLEYCNLFLATEATENLKNKTKEIIELNNMAIELINDSVDFIPKLLGEEINTLESEYSPTISIDGKVLVFTRLKASESGGKPQEDFYTSTLENGKWQTAVPIIEINTNNNEGAQSISADGKLIFFTACNRRDGFGSCDIYFTRKINNVWTHPLNVGFPVNSADWESQPSISGNGEYLYFSSTRKDGKGGKDIWRCQLLGFKQSGLPYWGEIENLGDSINTLKDEISPFIHSDGKTLYFASDGRGGMGKTDIFYSRLNSDNSWNKAKNIGYPINSHLSEQGFIVDASATKGYYASERSDSTGLDIYTFNLYEEARPKPVSYIEGAIVDAKNNLPISANIELIDINTNTKILSTKTSINDNNFIACLPSGGNYSFNISKEGYLFYSDNFELEEKHASSNPYHLDIKLNPIELNGTVVMRNVFFDSNSSELQEKSFSELAKLIEFLKTNTNVRIQIGGHTDNIGTEEYNLKLSEERAKSVYQYLIDNGISVSQVQYKGYGMSAPIDENDTEKSRALNRRTEFKIIFVNSN